MLGALWSLDEFGFAFLGEQRDANYLRGCKGRTAIAFKRRSGWWDRPRMIRVGLQRSVQPNGPKT